MLQCLERIPERRPQAGWLLAEWRRLAGSNVPASPCPEIKGATSEDIGSVPPAALSGPTASAGSGVLAVAAAAVVTAPGSDVGSIVEVPQDSPTGVAVGEGSEPVLGVAENSLSYPSV